MLKMTDEEFMRIVDFMKSTYGISLIKKRVLVEGRLSFMVEQLEYNSFTEYLDKVIKNNDKLLLTEFVNKLTTNHTYFMREPDHFEFLKNNILPGLKEKNKNKIIEIWCAASSSGEEPYTIAMTVLDFLGLDAERWKVNILATDLSTKVLKKAKLGEYTEDMLKDVPDSWKKIYFEHNGNIFTVKENVKKLVTYKQFNLMNAIPFIDKFDLVSCRNVMIYFDSETKEALVKRIYETVKSGGYFFTGHAETISRNDNFIYRKPAIYQKP